MKLPVEEDLTGLKTEARQATAADVAERRVGHNLNDPRGRDAQGAVSGGFDTRSPRSVD